MRIISGKYGKRKFQVPSSFKARPTTDMAKENLFNILQNQVEWTATKALDLFAGTGSIGFEMLSRGASSVLAIEKDYRHVSFIKKVATELKDPNYKIVHLDALKWLNGFDKLETMPPFTFDLIFADPPYALPEISNIPSLISKSGLLAQDGLLIFEHPKSISFSGHPGFVEVRNYGAVHFSFFRGI